MTTPSPFPWRHVEPDISVRGVRWALRARHPVTPRVITVDTHVAYPLAVSE